MSMKETLFGKDCTLCEGFGVTCHDVGIIDSTEADFGQSVIYLHDEHILTTNQNIASCPVILGEKSPEEITSKIKENAVKARSHNIFNHEPPPLI